jgi:hypothetical protein
MKMGMNLKTWILTNTQNPNSVLKANLDSELKKKRCLEKLVRTSKTGTCCNDQKAKLFSRIFQKLQILNGLDSKNFMRAKLRKARSRSYVCVTTKEERRQSLVE